MKEQIDAILRTLEEAQRQVARARANATSRTDCADTLDNVEVGLNQIKEKLKNLKAKDA